MAKGAMRIRKGNFHQISRVRLMESEPVMVLPISALITLGYSVIFTGFAIVLINQQDRTHTVLATRVDDVMTVVMDEFHGIYFEDNHVDYTDMPDLIAISADESDDHDDDCVQIEVCASHDSDDQRHILILQSLQNKQDMLYAF